MQLKFNAIDRAQHLTMHLLHHCRISREAAGIELLHLTCQFLHFFRRLGIALNHLPQLVQLAYSLLICALGIGRIAGGVSRRRPLRRLAITVIAGIYVAPDRAIGTTATAVAHVTALSAALACAISRMLAEAATLRGAALCSLACLPAAGPLSTAVARLLSVISRLPLLIAILPVLIALALLTVSAQLSALAIPALLATVATARGGHRLKLAPQPLHLA